MPQPHVHSITLFDVERIIITTDPDQRYQTIAFEGIDAFDAVTVCAWRGAGNQQKPPEIVCRTSVAALEDFDP